MYVRLITRFSIMNSARFQYYYIEYNLLKLRTGTALLAYEDEAEIPS